MVLVDRLCWLIENEKKNQAWTLLEDIFPVYWKERNGIPYTLWPVIVYRALYYLDWPNLYARDTRYSLWLMGAHLEGLMHVMPGCVVGRPLGYMVKNLKNKNELPDDLTADLLEFNRVANIPAKHLAADAFLPKR
ncbi:MAG: hypothetical protein HYU39_09275 [Thaumarchaeota archaeon]|nr:hypothetical protein [Nitrososphaerota archaeon]